MTLKWSNLILTYSKWWEILYVPNPGLVTQINIYTCFVMATDTSGQWLAYRTPAQDRTWSNLSSVCLFDLFLYPIICLSLPWPLMQGLGDHAYFWRVASTAYCKADFTGLVMVLIAKEVSLRIAFLCFLYICQEDRPPVRFILSNLGPGHAVMKSP